jgi:hypothetical protein
MSESKIEIKLLTIIFFINLDFMLQNSVLGNNPRIPIILKKDFIEIVVSDVCSFVRPYLGLWISIE